MASMEQGLTTLKYMGMDHELDNLMARILYGQAKTDLDYTAPAYTSVVNPTIRNMSELQGQLGTNIETDRSAIQAIYDAATAAAKESELEQQGYAERGFYKNMASAQDTMADTIRKQQGSAIASGVNKGMTAANILSTVLGTSQSAADEATKLAQDRQALGSKYAAQMESNAAKALETSTNNQEYLASLARQLYNDDIQRKTAELSYNQGINTDRASVAASKYTAYSNANSAALNAAVSAYNNNTSAYASLLGAIEQANANRDYGNAYASGLKAQADATRYSADKNAEATRYNSDVNYRIAKNQ